MNRIRAQYVAFIVIFISVIVLIGIRKNKESLQSFLPISKLPNFEATNINGDYIRSNDYLGKDLYIQFINSRYYDDQKLFETVYSNWANKDIDFLIITDDLNRIKQKEILNNNNISIIDKNYPELYAKFMLKGDDGSYFIVNKNGNLVNSGNSILGYEKGPKIYLQQLIERLYFSISELLEEKRDISEFPWFAQITDVINNNIDKKSFVISLYTTICDSCSGGQIIRTLESIDNKWSSSVYILSILNKEFNIRDIENLRSQLKVEHPIIIANDDLNKKWNSLIKKYRKDYLTDIVFILDRSGRILKIAYRTCDCFPAFFEYLHSLIKEIKS